MSEIIVRTADGRIYIGNVLSLEPDDRDTERIRITNSSGVAASIVVRDIVYMGIRTTTTFPVDSKA